MADIDPTDEKNADVVSVEEARPLIAQLRGRIDELRHQLWCADVNADGYKEHIAELEIEAQRFAACRHQARYMQEDGGEAAFVKAIDAYMKKNEI